MKKTGEIADAINSISQDIKAEVLIADFMENGLNAEEFVVFPSGTFRRRFSTDIRKAEVFRLNNNQNLLAIHVNRDGIYDSLPEGLFHSSPEQPLRGSTEMSMESKKLRSEEKETRAFFVPFENEIFLQRVALEMGERMILNRFSETLFDEIYPEFWNFDKSLDTGFVSKLVLLLHFSHRIAGNPQLTARCLELIIHDKVVVKITHPEKKAKKSEEQDAGEHVPLGSARLGMDFVCGSTFDDMMPTMEFIIGPLQNGMIRDFLGSGRTSEFLGCFYDYFVPAGVGVKTTVLIDRAQQHFVLGNNQFAPTLGFDSGI
jgi:hypothetical protein